MDNQSIELEAKQAKQRASVKWILSKAFNNRVPENLKEPFYRDHEGQEHLKPQIVVDLGNATLYCQTLSNLYSDPNYQSLNHWSILQTLSRKGVPLNEANNVQLTETVLIQTNPLRVNAHMSVIEALMVLYAKEVATLDRISAVIGRVSGGLLPSSIQGHENALLYWVSHACAALKRRIDQEIELGAIDEDGARTQSPYVPPVRDYKDLCDGVCIAFLISYYCPKVVPWTLVRVNHLPSVEDSIHNILLVLNFSQKHLPYSVFHMTPEDISYMRGSMRTNLIVLLADLFNLFEIHPAKCVSYPGSEQIPEGMRTSVGDGTNEHGICHRRGLTSQPVTPIPDLRSGLESPPHSAGYGGSSSGASSASSKPQFQVARSPSATQLRRPTPPKDTFVLHQEMGMQQQQQQQQDDNNGFVVHKSRGVPTLSSMHQQQQQQEPLIPARLRLAKEKTNVDSKADERGDSTIAAGRPSDWGEQRRPSFAGRRSRRNSLTDDSQLTIENFGGSQDHLNLVGRLEKERERKISSASMGEPAVAIRSSAQDARGTLQIGYEMDAETEKQDRETEKIAMKRQASVENVSLRNMEDLNKNKKTTSFATLPNTTTWQQQSLHHQQAENNSELYSTEDTRPLADASKLSTVRMKLEEKRRLIEQEKRKLELAMSRQQQKVGQAAFLQAINKHLELRTKNGLGEVEEGEENDDDNEDDKDSGKSTSGGSGGVVIGNDDDNEEEEGGNKKKDSGGDGKVAPNSTSAKPERPCSLQDITSDMNNVESKWAATHIETKKTPDLDQMDLEQYQQIIAKMNVNLHDIQADIQRLTSQQSQNHAQHIQAQQLLQAQQIANMISQYGSQQNLSSVGGGMGGPGGMMYHHRSPMQQQQHHHQMMSYGSTPQLAQSNFGGGNNMGFVMRSAPLNRDFAQNQFVDEQGRYVNQNNSSFNREGSPYSGHQNNYNQQQMMNNGNCDNGQMYDNYSQNMGGNEYMQPQQLHKNYLSRERLNQGNNPPYYGDGGNNGNYSNQMQSNQFYLHDQNVAHHQTPPVPPQRRTWAQSAAQNPLPLDIAAWSQNSPKSTSLNNSAGGGFKLHQNGGDNDNSYRTNSHNNSVSNLFPVHSSSPQHNRVHRQISQMIDDSNRSLDQQQQHQHQQQQSSRNLDNRMPKSPPADEMAPQSISFIGDEDSVDLSSTPLKMSNVFNRQNSGKNMNLEESLGKLNISSGSRTYRIPSPTRPLLNAKSFQDPNAEDPNTGKGFYISFDSEAPKRPKPPLRTKRSPKKEQSLDKSSDLNQHNELDNSDRFATTTRKSAVDHNNHENSMRFQGEPVPAKRHHITDTGSERMTHYSYDQQQTSQQIQQRKHLEDVTNYEPQIMHNVNYNNNNESRTNDSPDCKALLIGNNLDPSSVDEMEKKKEKIMLMSLQRRQQQEEAKARKEIEAMQRREREQMKEDEKMRKKEEQAARRQAILEAHKLKKAIDEAEREGKVIDKADLMLLKQQQQALQIHPAAVRRPQKTTRPRPKTIHVESGSVDISEASSLGSSRGKKGSNSNLTGMGRTLSSTSMRRDYYRGSQDSLIRESPDEYPSNSSTPIGRRGSYKTREPPPQPQMERGRTMSRISVPKGAANFRGRKSNSLMNLCDTDSGLGRATPPRRAPSPGMGGGGGSQAIGRHLPSPSGPGSLPPGLMNKRRIFDDGSSDISSNQSSMMDYNGPKLYKQPAAKSNRGIILNAVEYCVFPGVVNRDAKQKVLEKIARSEAKHFLILFRDAGCQFRALYGYYPETEQVSKLFGTGPSQVDEYMFDKFFKYNSGGKCFSQIHTKHLTVTIDAFTIHNSLWQGKKVNLPSKKDMTLVI